MSSIDPEVYLRNIASLRARQPEVVSAIETATGPLARLVAGRDGSPTFLIRNEGGEAWLGGSSMPGVSAEEVFRGFAGGHENVFVPGIMAGREVLHLANRLGRHAAIFVIEQSAYHLHLALRLCDLSGFIERGQIAFLIESDFETQLLALFQRFPGYLLPSRILTIPHRSRAEHAELQPRIERAGAQLARQQAHVLAGLRDSLASQATTHQGQCDRMGGVIAGSARRVAVLSTDASDATRENARRVSTAIHELGWSYACCIPVRPEHCHPIARLRCMEEIAANCVILVNSPPGCVRALAPEGVPIISWYFASARVPAATELSDAGDDFFAVTCKTQQAQLVAAGVPEGKVYYAGITAALIAPREPPIVSKDSQPERGKPALDVLVEGDAPDDRPESAGITMSTHAALWRECMKIAADHVAKSKITQAAELLALAEKRSGAKLSDARIRGEMIQKVEERVVPAAFGRHLARQLTERFKVGFNSANWPIYKDSSARFPTPDTAVAHDQFSNAVAPAGDLLGKARQACWVVMPFFSTTALQSAVDILAAGGCVTLRAGRTPLADAHPEFREASRFIPTFTNVRQAVEIVSKEAPWSADEVGAAMQGLSLNVVLPRVLEAAHVARRHHGVLGAVSPA